MSIMRMYQNFKRAKQRAATEEFLKRWPVTESETKPKSKPRAKIKGNNRRK